MSRFTGYAMILAGTALAVVALGSDSPRFGGVKPAPDAVDANLLIPPGTRRNLPLPPVAAVAACDPLVVGGNDVTKTVVID